MDAKTPNNSEIINSVRNLAISRRGGVRTRGGRLPPINMRELTTSNKKMIAPKIPVRRKVVIKTENGTSEQLFDKAEKPTSFENTRGRGKSRSQKVFLQTGGTFLAEGPAARLKRDHSCDDSFSTSRVSRRSAKAGCDKNIDADTVKDLMDSYVAGQEYENDNEGKPPLRLPLQKEKVNRKIKQESDEDDKTKIKKEIIEDFETGIKKEIKTENEDFVTAEDSIKKEESEKCITDNFLNVKAEKGEDFFTAKDIKETESKKSATDSFIHVKDNGALILLQLPLLLDSLKIANDETDKAPKEKDKLLKENESKIASKFVDNFEEGFLGKLKIMKSGRMRLTLGSVDFELLDGTPSESYQEVTSVKVVDGEGDVTVLGKVEKKLILSPIINKLLSENVGNSKTLNFEEE